MKTVNERRVILSFRFFAESVTFTLMPLSCVCVPTRPRVRAADLVPADPRSLVAALTGRTRTDAVAVRLPGRPAAAVGAAVVEGESAADLRRRPLMLIGGPRFSVHRHGSHRDSETRDESKS